MTEYVKYGTIGIAILAIIGIFIWFLSENKKLTNETIKLKAEIALLQAHQDTIYVPGKKDTVVVTKWLKTPTVKVKNRDIDTLIETPEHYVNVRVDSENVNIDISCLAVEKQITRIDTIKIPIPKLVEVQIPCKPDPWYDSKGAYLGYGIAGTVAVIKLLSELLSK